MCTFAGSGDLTARLLTEAFASAGNDIADETVRGVIGLPPGVPSSRSPARGWG
jgi:hypothetical protein